MAFAEVDGTGNVNVSRLSKLPHVLAGVGGFIDILQNVKKVVFCGTLTAGGVKVLIEGGKLRVEQEGKVIKFVRQVQHLTFNAPLAMEKGQEVIYITERGVFRLQPGGMVLVEVAPGLDVKRDIAPVVEFQFKISRDLREIDACLFRPKPMGLKDFGSWK
jgi:propionate CoA-transferase